MKQFCVFDKDYNEIEYHEFDENDKIIYSKYTRYFSHIEKKLATGLTDSSPIIHSIKDSNGWVRIYDILGVLQKECGSPNPHHNTFANGAGTGGTISGVLTNCVANPNIL